MNMNDEILKGEPPHIIPSGLTPEQTESMKEKILKAGGKILVDPPPLTNEAKEKLRKSLNDGHHRTGPHLPMVLRDPVDEEIKALQKSCQLKWKYIFWINVAVLLLNLVALVVKLMGAK